MSDIVSAEKAQEWLDGGPAYIGFMDSLAHTVVVQAEQIAAVLALHERGRTIAYCVQDEEDWPCATLRALGVTA